MLVLILSIAYAAVSCKIFAAYRIRKSFGPVFPCISAYLLFSALRTLLSVNFSFHTRQTLYAIGEPLDLMLESLAVVEIFRVVTERHFPVRKWGTRFLAGFAFIGVCASFASHYAWVVTAHGWLQRAVMAERYAGTVMVTVLALTWYFLRITREIPESPAARKAVQIMSVYAVCSTVIAGMMVATGMSSWWVVSVAPAANGLLAGILWATVFPSVPLKGAAAEPVARWEIGILHSLERELREGLSVRRRLVAK